MNYRWNFVEPTNKQDEEAKALSKALGLHPILGRLLVNRGITEVGEARRFFHPQLNELLEPIRARRKKWEQNIEEVYRILENGSAAAREVAAQTLNEVRAAMKINYFEDKALIAEQAAKYKAE